MGIRQRAALRKQQAAQLVLSPAGEIEFDKALLEYQVELEEECDRIELGQRTGGKQEVTPLQVQRAVSNLRFEPRKKKPSNLYLIARVGSPLAGALLGFSAKLYNHPWGAAGMITGILVIGAAEFYKYHQETR